MPKLYELPERYRSFYKAMMEEGTEDQKETLMVLEAIDDEFKEKVESCCRVLADLKGQIELFENESRRLSGKAKSLRSRASWLRSYVQENMEAMALDEIEGDLFRAKICNTAPSVSVTDLDLVPSEYDRERPRELNKTALKETLSSGQEVPGCELKTTKSLRIT